MALRELIRWVGAWVVESEARAGSAHFIEDYVRSGEMTVAQARALRQAIHADKNILVVGGTGSGKTSLINAIIAEITRAEPQARFVLVEDAAELQCVAPNSLRYRSPGEVSMQQLVRTSLRMRPDVIVIDELGYGSASSDLPTAWSSTVRRARVIVSIHGDSAERLSRSRLETLIPVFTRVPDLVVVLQRGKPRVKETLTIVGHANGAFIFERMD